MYDSRFQLKSKGYDMLTMKKLGAVLAIFALTTSAANAADWTWEDEFRTFAAGEVRGALPEALQSYATETTGTLYGEWQYATAPAGLDVWISAHCARFIEQMGLAAMTDTGSCVTTTYLVNGKDPGTVLVNERWLLPSLENDPAELQENFAALAESAAAAAALAEPLTRGEAQDLLRGVVVTLTIDDAVKEMVIAEVGRQIAAIPAAAAATVTDAMVQNALTAYMLEHGEELGVESLPADLTDRFAAVTTRLDGVDTRLNTIETTTAENKTRLDGVDTRLTSIESTGASKSGLWVALGALLIASTVAYVVMFRVPSKNTVTTEVTKAVKTLADRSDGVAQMATAAKDAAEKANTAAAAAQSAVAAVDAKATLAQTTATQAHTLAVQNFDSIHGLMQQQFFPTQVELDALPVDGFINLVFEADRKQHTLIISRDSKGLKIEGLAGRARVAVTDHKSVLNTIVRAFAKAKAEKTSAVHAFAVVKAVKPAVAA